MGTIKLTALTMERALAPGSELEIEYDLIVTNVWMVSAWLASMERKFANEEPLWQYLGYRWDPDTNVIVFRFRVRQYQMDIDTQEIIPLDPVTLEPVPPRKTKYYASAHYIVTMIAVASVGIGVSVVSWLSYRKTTLVLAAVEAGTISPEQGTTILGAPVVQVGKTAGAGMIVAGAALVLFILWRWFK